MKKKLLALLLMVLIPLSAAYAATAHYGYVTPTVGGSQNTWGTLLNTIFGAIDTNIWAASGGMTTAVNAQSSSANITLTNPINSVQNITMTTTGKKLILPAMNAMGSLVPGGQFLTINNVGSNSFDVDAQDGTTGILVGLAGGKSVQIQLLTNGTANGTFQTYGPYLTSVSGNVSLGTSVSATNPSNATATNTGLFSSTTGTIGASILGTQVGSWSSGGYNGAIGATTSSTVIATTITAANTAISGTTTTNNLIVTGTCTGCGTAGITKVSVQTFCASGCTHTAGTYTPTAGTKFVIAEMAGGGGGGGGANTNGYQGVSGASGGYLKALLTSAQLGSSQTITIGAAGTAGSSAGGNGGAGGTTSVGSLLSCAGGSGGSGNNTNGGGGTGVSGGSATVTTGTTLLVITGQASGGTFNFGPTFIGSGGSNPLGFGSPATGFPSSGAVNGTSGTGYGSGGGGAASAGSAETGAVGQGGIVIFTEYQ